MYSSIQVCARILVQPILIDSKDRVVSGHEAKYLKVALTF